MELLIVAVILAILAVMVVPLFGEAGHDVKLSALKATLQTVRSQLHLYKLQHNDEYPKRSKFEQQTTSITNMDGTVDPDGGCGPYFLRMPANPIDNDTKLRPVQSGEGGWMYDQDTGTFKSNDASVLEADSPTKDL